MPEPVPEPIKWSVSADSEGESGSGHITYTITRTGDLSQAASIDFAITGGDAVSGVDYTSAMQTISFLSGEASQTITVNILNDSTPEISENVIATISNPTIGEIQVASYSGYILDDDSVQWNITATDGREGSGGYISYTIVRTGDLSQAASINFSTTGGVSSPSLDYISTQQVINFSAGEGSKTLQVATIDDANMEANETVVGSITMQSTGIITSNNATAKILDDDQSIWSISSVSDKEAGGHQLVFTVSRTGDVSSEATIDFKTAGGTATAGVDYTSLSQTLSFAAGEASKTTLVTMLDDFLPEQGETVLGTISSASAGAIDVSSSMAVITDDDQINWSISAISNIDESAAQLGYIITRTGDGSSSATIDFSTTGGVASPGIDYIPVQRTLTFAVGETQKYVWVDLISDVLPESNESVVATISNPSAGNISVLNTSGTLITGSASASILDNDQSLWGITSLAGVVEGPNVRMGYTVYRIGDVSSAASIDFATAGGTAVAGVDYSPVLQTLNFAAGESGKIVWVDVLDDTIIEASKTVVASISHAATGTILTTTATSNLYDNDQSLWAVATANPSLTNVDEALGNKLVFTVSRIGDISSAATIDISTSGGGSTAGVDFDTLQQTLNFAAGESNKTVYVDIIGDALPEPNETVLVSINNASSGTLLNATATATIQDNDQMIWSVATSHPSVNAAAELAANALTFVVSRVGDITSAATIEFATAGGTATAGMDYTSAVQTLSFAAGEANKVVLVNILDDTIPEPNETVTAIISKASSGTISTTQISQSILENDSAVWSLSVSASSDEDGGNRLGYVVTRAGDQNRAATIEFATTGGTATAGLDYTPVLQTLSFAAGEVSKTIWVDVLGDILPEANETVAVSIRSPSYGAMTVPSTSATIFDNDQSIWAISALNSSIATIDEVTGNKLFYTVSRTGSVSQAATIEFQTMGGTATAGVDYAAVIQTLSFAEGEATKVVWVDIIGDATPEPNETIVSVIDNASTGTITTAGITQTIQDNDQPIWSMATIANSEEDGGARLGIIVTRTGDVSQVATIDIKTGGGSATAIIDYTPINQTLTFASGETTKVIYIDLIGDSNPEPNESVFVQLGNASSGTIATPVLAPSILDNDQPVWSISGVLSADESSGNRLAYLVSRTGGISEAATIDFTTAGGIATAGVDYTSLSQTLSFAVGEISKMVWVDVLADTESEVDEGVTAAIQNASSGTITGGFSSLNILDNDKPVWNIAVYTSIDEGNGARMGFQITRSGNYSQAATIDFATAGGNATAGVDYTPVLQTLNFAAGETTKVVWVNVLGDTLAEPNESILGTISNASSGTILTTNSSGTLLTGSINASILDNDQSLWSIAAANSGNAIVDEGIGNRTAYTISRTGGISSAATISFSTSGGTATAGVDYTHFQQTLSFAAGETAKTLFVDIIGDNNPEPNETIIGNISNPSTGSIITFNAAQTIVDNDQSVWSVAVASTSLTLVAESTGNKLVYLVARTGDVSQTATVNFATVGGTATAGLDYTVVDQILNFAAGEAYKVVCVDVIGDVLLEANETVTVGITNVSKGAIATGAATQTILDNDQSVWSVALAQPAVAITDEDGGNRLAYVVSRTGATNSAATIDFRTAGGTATAGVDYTSVNRVLNFAAGETNKVVLVDLLGDSLPEPNETVVATIGNASTGTIVTTSVTHTVLDNDQPLWSVGILSNGDGEGGSRIGFTVTRTGNINQAATVDFKTAGGTATVGVDYTAVNQILNFAAGETAKVIWMDVIGDFSPELSDTVVASITNASIGTIVSGSTTQTILDNDQSLWALSAVASADEASGANVSFSITRSGDVSLAATIDFKTAGGTATAGVDYTSLSQTLNFAAGETIKVVSINVLGDSLLELNETLTGQIGNVSTGTIVTAVSTVSILDNDQSLWNIAILANADEDGGNRLSFSVSRTGDINQAATIDFKTAGGTAAAGVDYTSLSQTLNFAAGETAKVVWVDLLGDSTPESNETVVGTIANASTGTIVTGATSQTILDNDQSLWNIALLANADEDGGNRLSFSVSRAGDISQAATIDFATIGGTATSGVDYTALQQSLIFAAGETLKVVTVDLIGDYLPEQNETIMAGIGNQSTGLVTTATATAVAFDNDQSLWSITSLANEDEDTGNKVGYSISRSGDISQAASINFATIGGTATAGIDYTSLSQTLSFAAGETMKVVWVDVIGDSQPELDETIIGVISDASSGSIATANASNVVLNNDQSIWAVTSSTVLESNDTSRIFFSITRSGDVSTAATIDFSTDAGTATPNVDYVSLQQTLTFAAGETFKNVFVDVMADSVLEPTETIIGVITNASTGTISSGATASSILENDQSIWSVAVASSTLVIADESADNKLAYLVSRSGDYSAAATVGFMTAGGTATADVDYMSLSQTLNFAAGETQKLVWVNILSDTVAESNESVNVIIKDASAGTIVTGVVSQTIIDNDQSLWSVAAIATINEASGNRLGFTISRTGDINVAASIVVASAGGTATAGVDYTALQQTLSFAAGETIKVVYLDVIGDTILEPNESVYMTIGNASTGSILTSNAAQTISDNDIVTWSLSAGTNPIESGDGRIYTHVVRGGDISQAATIDVITAGGTAIGGQDYSTFKQTLSFAAGETNKVVHLNILGDTLLEVNETVLVSLANASIGTIVTATATQTIAEDDQDMWGVAVATNPDEDGGNKMSFTVSRTGSCALAATIDFATVGGTAIAGQDYTALRQTLNFAAGETMKLITVNMLGDTTPELSETIVAAISNNSTGTITAGATTGTILDNDLSAWSVSSVASSNEDGNNRLAYNITRTGSLSSAATITFATAGGTATAGVDYTAINQSLNFSAGESTKTVWVNLIGDSIGEVDESIIAVIGNASAGTISTASVTGAIIDNDYSRASFSISVVSNNVYESSGAVAYFISRTGDLSSSQTVFYSMGAGTATAATDYTAASSYVTFAQGESSKVISINLINDATIESSETITVQLSNASMGAITTALATATILDDDTVPATSYSVSTANNSPYEPTGAVAFSVTRSGNVNVAATTYFRTNGGTAQTDGSDYTVINSQALSWRVGETSKIVFVNLINDSIAEVSETIIGQIASDSGFTAGLSTTTATILDDDTIAATGYTIAVTSTNVIESTGVVAFTLSRTGDISAATTTYFRTSGGTAQIDGSDYTVINSQTLNWGAGEATKVVLVNLTNDSVTEGNETIIGQISTNAGFTTGLLTATATILDDDIYTSTAGGVDTLTTGTLSGAYKGGYMISTGDMNDTVTIGGGQLAFTNIDLGTGNDTLNAGATPANLIVRGAHYQGGAGVDTLSFLGTTAWTFSGTASTGDMVKEFEVLSLGGTGNQIVNLSLQDVLEMTAGNAIANTIKITGNTGDSLNLQVAGKALQTITSGGVVLDVDGSAYSAVTSAQGASSANDVTISGQNYDVYVYNAPSSIVTLLIDTDIVVNTV